jgi:hypothetical protein
MEENQNRQSNRQNISPMTDSNEASRKYEEKIKILLDLLRNVDYSENGESQQLFEEHLMELEKTIDEECLSRITKTHEINMKFIAKLSQLKYDFNHEKNLQDYDSLRKNAAEYLLSLNCNLN